VLPNDSVGVGQLPYEEIVDPNATTMPMQSTPGIDSPAYSLEFRQLEPNIFNLYLVYLHRLFLHGITHTHNPAIYTSKPTNTNFTEVKNVVQTIWADLPQGPN